MMQESTTNNTTKKSAPELEILTIADAELDVAFELLRVLRPHLDAPLFRDRLARQQREIRYELVGAWLPESTDAKRRLVGLIGIRPGECMAWGPHIHIDDLVTAVDARGLGVGRALMRWCEQLATERGLPAVYLEARVTAIGFYEREGYETHPSPVMRRLLD